MKKVLIALDYGAASKVVADEGYALAKAFKANVVLLHVISDPLVYAESDHVTVMGFAGDRDTIAGESIAVTTVDPKEISQKFLEKLKKHLKDETIEIVVAEGVCSDVILIQAKERKADIIVLGCHGRKRQENISIGTVNEQVLQYAEVPLYIVPSKKMPGN